MKFAKFMEAFKAKLALPITPEMVLLSLSKKLNIHKPFFIIAIDEFQEVLGRRGSKERANSLSKGGHRGARLHARLRRDSPLVRFCRGPQALFQSTEILLFFEKNFQFFFF